MGINQVILAEIKQNNNMITTSQVVALGFSRALLTKYVKEGLLERGRQGVYLLPDSVHDDMYTLMSSVDSAFAHVLDHAADAEKTYNALKTQILYMALGGVGLAFVYAACLMGMVILSPRMATVKDATLYGQLDVIGVIPAIEERPAYVREKDKTYEAVP